MRGRICKKCGVQFQGEKEQHLCPACRSAVRAATVIRPRACISCGCTFDGGPRAKYCPECRGERNKKTIASYRKRKAAGNCRPLGSVDICASCGKEYIVTGSLQKYCPSCAPDAVREAVLPKKRERAANHREEMKYRKDALKECSTVCAYCGKPYTPTSPSVTCSPECAREYKRITQGWIDYRRGKRKTPPKAERYRSGLPQSDVIGVSYNRARKKWQVTHEGKYIGLFPTREEAESKKRELQSAD